MRFARQVVFGSIGAGLVGVLSLIGLGLSATVDRDTRQRAVFDPALVMSPHVRELITRSCADCHSKGAPLPWYANMPPGSWMLAEDIRKAQNAMSLSEWSKRNGRSRGMAVATLTAMCADVKSGRMPRPKYLWMHPEARMTPEDIDSFCAWTVEQMARSKGLGNPSGVPKMSQAATH